MPIIPNLNFETDWLYLVNYYGQLTNDKISLINQNIKNLILDNVQSFFQMPINNIPTIYSCRKYFGVSDGAYLYSENELSQDLDIDISFYRTEYLMGRYEKSANDFYQSYVLNEKAFSKEPIKKMSKLTNNLMRSFEYDRIQKSRAGCITWKSGRSVPAVSMPQTIPTKILTRYLRAYRHTRPKASRAVYSRSKNSFLYSMPIFPYVAVFIPI